MAALSDFLENKLIDFLFRGQALGITGASAAAGTGPTSLYVGLYTANPTDAAGGTEVTGGSYARQAAVFGTASSGVEATTDAQNWTSMPAVTVTHFGFWSAATAGTWEGGGPLTSSLTVPAGATVAAAIGALTVQVQG